MMKVEVQKASQEFCTLEKIQETVENKMVSPKLSRTGIRGSSLAKWFY